MMAIMKCIIQDETIFNYTRGELVKTVKEKDNVKLYTTKASTYVADEINNTSY